MDREQPLSHRVHGRGLFTEGAFAGRARGLGAYVFTALALAFGGREVAAEDISLIPTPWTYGALSCSALRSTVGFPTSETEAWQSFIDENLAAADEYCSDGVTPRTITVLGVTSEWLLEETDVVVPCIGTVTQPRYFTGNYTDVEKQNLRFLDMETCPGLPGGGTFVVRSVRDRLLDCPAGGGWIDTGFGCNRGTGVDRERAAGSSPLSCPIANPVNPNTGNKFQTERDFRGSGPFPLRFERYYNSDPLLQSTRMGERWRHTYSRSVTALREATPRTAVLYREDGKVWYYAEDPVSGEWVSDPDVTARLVELLDASFEPAGFELTTDDDTVEVYDIYGRLVSMTNRAGHTQTLAYDAMHRLSSITDHFGRTLTLGYDERDLLESVTDNEGNVHRYEHDAIGNLTKVIYPDDDGDPDNNEARRYRYEENLDADPGDFPYALTGIEDLVVDESVVRPYATFDYDEQGRAILSEHAGGADATTLTYNADGTTTVTDALGAQSLYTFEVQFGLPKPAAIDSPCAGCGAQASTTTYDANGFLASRTDFNGNLTTFDFNERGLEESRTEAVGTPEERTTTTQWHPEFRLPTLITEPGKTTAFTYDAQGQVLTRTETDPATGESRTTTFTYTAEGLIESIDGPRTDVADVTSFEYDLAGNLVLTTNALGQETAITAYDLNGRPLSTTDPNGLVTTLTYDARGRLATRTVGGETTSFDYDLSGNIARTTLADGTFLDFTYDDAGRLIRVDDNLGNHIVYTLDAAGNRTAEATFDETQTLRRTLSRTFNTLNRLVSQTGGAGQATQFAYDAQGNRTSVTDPRGQETTFAFDALNRLVSETDPQSPVAGVSEFGYDPLDRVTSVTDPRGLETTFTYNAFGEVLTEMSPDTGETTYTYDAAGNRLSETDARGITATYTYDALNRVTSITYPDSTENITFEYDQGTNGIGRLTRMTDESGVTDFAYDARGNVITESRTLEGVLYTTAYAYDALDRIESITYPSGAIVTYSRDALGRVASVDLDVGGTVTPLVSGIAYEPFGPMKGLTFGNGLNLARTFDLDYRLTAQTTAGLQDLTFGYDANDNIETLTDGLDAARTQSFTYDEVNRLKTADGLYGSRTYHYDLIGNRTALDADQVPAAFDPSLQRTTQVYAFNDRRRLESVTVEGLLAGEYRYDAIGQRIEKQAAGAVTFFHYDRSGNLIAETDSAGNTLREYVYLDGLRIAQRELQPPETGLYFIHTDHLGTSKVLSDEGQAIAWQADHSPFGTAVTTTESLEHHLRFPGQYFDGESGMHYNYFRDYDPSTGRYIEADPLGMFAGINTYAYADNNPLNRIDPFGLVSTTPSPWWAPDQLRRLIERGIGAFGGIKEGIDCAFAFCERGRGPRSNLQVIEECVAQGAPTHGIFSRYILNTCIEVCRGLTSLPGFDLECVGKACLEPLGPNA